MALSFREQSSICRVDVHSARRRRCALSVWETIYQTRKKDNSTADCSSSSCKHPHHSPKHTCPHCRRRVHFNKLVCCRLCVTLIEKVNIGKERRQRQHSLPSSLLADIHTVSEGDNWQRTIGSDSKCQVDAVCKSGRSTRWFALLFA